MAKRGTEIPVDPDSNAIKFSRRSSCVRVCAEPHGAEVCFSVSDVGPGIDQSNLPHLFERYWQARPADRRGAGLGLSIAKGIVDAHGGRIWADTQIGTGSTFSFALPVAQP